MKNKILSAGFLLSMMALFLACNRAEEVKTAAPAIDKEQIKSEIQALENHFASIYDSRKADSLSYYADSAISYFNGRKPVAGKAAIHKFIDEELMNYPKGAKIAFETEEIYIGQDGRYVFEIGAYKQIDSTGGILQRGHYFSLFEKINGRYMCIRDMANSNPVED
jgi:ketosteroid isomerase-like protein